MKHFITPALTSLTFWITTAIICAAVVFAEIVIYSQIKAGEHARDITTAWIIFALVPIAGIFAIVLARIAAESINIVFRIERHLRVVSASAALTIKQDRAAAQSRPYVPRIEPRL